MGEIINVRRSRYDGPRGRVPDWSQTDPAAVRACLTVLAEEGGNTKRTVERCKAEGLYPASAWQLEKWRDDEHPKVWVDVHSENEKRLEQIAEAKARTNAIRASDVAARAIETIDRQIGDATLLDAAKGLDSVVKAQSVSIDAVLKLSGRPVQGGTAGSVVDILSRLKQLAPDLVVDGTVEDADVVDDDEPGER